MAFEKKIGEVNSLHRTDLRRVSQLRDEERTSVRRKCEAEANCQIKMSTDRFKVRKIVPSRLTEESGTYEHCDCLRCALHRDTSEH